MPQIEIRPATKEDIEILSELRHSYQTVYVWQMERLLEDNITSITFRETRLPRCIQVEYPHSIENLKLISARHGIMLVAVIHNIPVGYIKISNIPQPNAAWIEDLVIDIDLRRKGIATGLVLAAQEWARQKKYQRIILEMQSKNHPAIQLALKLGFEFSGYQDNYYANQDIALFFGRFLK